MAEPSTLAPEPTWLLRQEHTFIRLRLRRLERALGVLLGEPGRIDRALFAARSAAEELERAIPGHLEHEELLVAVLLETRASSWATNALEEHGEIDVTYERFLDGLAELERAAPEAERMRALATSTHALASQLCVHMRDEERHLFPAADETLTPGQKRALLFRMA